MPQIAASFPAYTPAPQLPALSPPLPRAPALTLDTGDDAVTYGDIAFLFDECPETLPLGIQGVVVKHTLIGGSTTTQPLGARIKDISWEGKFFERARSQNALLRAAAKAQTSQLLTWGVPGQPAYDAIIVDYDCEFHDRNEADYRISFSVTEHKKARKFKATSGRAYDPSKDVPTGNIDSAVAGQSDAYTSSYAQATANDTSAAAAALPTPASVTSAIAQVGPLSQAAGNTGGLQSFLTGAQTSVSGYLAALPALSPNQFYAGNMLTNLQLISANVARGSNNTVLRMDGAQLSLARQCAATYLDASLAYQVANANGKAFPLLSRGVGTAIVFPPFASGE